MSDCSNFHASINEVKTRYGTTCCDICDTVNHNNMYTVMDVVPVELYVEFLRSRKFSYRHFNRNHIREPAECSVCHSKFEYKHAFYLCRECFQLHMLPCFQFTIEVPVEW